MLLKTRVPTASGPKNAVTSEHITMQASKQQSGEGCSRENVRNVVHQNPTNVTVNMNYITKEKLQSSSCSNDPLENNRLDADLLEAFNNNPYTQSLHSSANMNKK